MNTKAIIAKLGGPARVAQMAGDITSQAVSQWRQIPASRCRRIAAASKGAVTVHDLRPDIYGPAPTPPDAPAPAQQEAA